MHDEHLITVGELLDRLQHYPRDTKISFSGLDFYRLKQRAENLIQVEFNQVVYRNSEGRVVVENLE
ncbi:hypothetical protein C3397_03650 [Enterobacter cloacae complex sp. ECNIH16]|nr:hypothetical protein WM95_16320 [Enterobacter cloacae complex sp. ECNIH7]POV42487.1 hypothetical protein C3394_03740 [Enterobacter cloacae complex sp. ECNIH11]POV46034.1 hypothetical protein C3397_03650 [Enterobacter cloacae complex sp. ECNIH16]CAE7103264.1 hypothetical protein AI2694V1_3129 [Enterobacter cloacae]SAF75069.1 Uncharacterised protein [Enterobacter asburiae]